MCPGASPFPSLGLSSPSYKMGQLDTILGPSSSESYSQKLHWAVDGTASPFLGWDGRGEDQLVSCGWGGDLGSLNFLFPRGNPGPAPPVTGATITGATVPTSPPGGGSPEGEGGTSHNGSLSPALLPTPESLRSIFQMGKLWHGEVTSLTQRQEAGEKEG